MKILVLHGPNLNLFGRRDNMFKASDSRTIFPCRSTTLRRDVPQIGGTTMASYRRSKQASASRDRPQPFSNDPGPRVLRTPGQDDDRS